MNSFYTTVCLLFSSLILGQANAQQESLAKVQMKHNELVETHAKLKNTLDKCKVIDAKRPNSNYDCGGWLTETPAEVAAMRKQFADLDQNMLASEEAVSKARARERVKVASGKVTLADFDLETRHLLMDFSALKNEIASTKSDFGLTVTEINALMSSIDRTLIGAYTAQAIEKALKPVNGKGAICEAVNSCSATKSLKGRVEKVEKQSISFEQFRAEYFKSLNQPSPKSEAAVSK